MKIRLLIPIIFALIPATLFSQSQIVTPLFRAALPDTGGITGFRTINFAGIAPAEGQYPGSWSNIEIAPLLTDPRLMQVNIIRYKDAAGNLNYAVDSEAGKTRGMNTALKFRKINDRMIADMNISLQPRTGNTPKPVDVAYQLMLRNQSVYARVAECREGNINVKGKQFKIRLMPPSANDPYYSISDSTVCLVDLNNDSVFTPGWKLSHAGDIISAEKISLINPFMVNSMKLRAASVDSFGYKLTCQEYFGDTALSAGFCPPNFSFVDISGTQDSLSSLKGKLVLMTFWSASCPFCEKVRPMLNELIEKTDSAKFLSIAFSNQPDIRAINDFMKDQPYKGTVVPLAPAVWRKFDRRGTTPAYYLIDSDGKIRIYGSGVSLFQVIQKMTQNLLTPQ